MILWRPLFLFLFLSNRQPFGLGETLGTGDCQVGTKISFDHRQSTTNALSAYNARDFLPLHMIEAHGKRTETMHHYASNLSIMYPP